MVNSSIANNSIANGSPAAGLSANGSVANGSVANGSVANGSPTVGSPPVPKRSSLPGTLLILISLWPASNLRACPQAVETAARPNAGSQGASRPGPAASHRGPGEQDTFPVPPHTQNSLFYLQRTPNSNTIICELNEKNGVPDKEEPVHVLWIRYGEHKQRQELSFVQRHFAYGLAFHNLGHDQYEFHFVSYKKIPLYLKKSPTDNAHHVYANIIGRQAILNRIYIKINPGGSFWSPNVEYLELDGTDPENGKALMQRIKI
jgi:hypothetical protein